MSGIERHHERLRRGLFGPVCHITRARVRTMPMWFIETEDKPLLFNIQTGGELEIVPRICPILPCVVPLHAV